MTKTSRIPGFYKLSPEERLAIVKDFANLSDDEVTLLKSMGGLSLETANRMIENVIGAIAIPLGVAVNFLINGKEYIIPMAIEEPSVIAAASHAAKLARSKGGFKANCLESTMIGQIQIVGVDNLTNAEEAIIVNKETILAEANKQDPILTSLGGGAKDLIIKKIKTTRGSMLIIELLIDCKDAMGANVVNRMAEAVAPLIESFTGGKVLLRIVSNLAVKRLARATVTISKEELGGEDVVDAILDAYAFAASDPFRAATHNKGIMNGIIAVLLATGNDTRAVEAGAHAYASLSGRYLPLTTWEKNTDGDLVGKIELPMAVGIIGGATHHPIARVCLKILNVKSAREFASVLAAVGLAQNLAALRALVTEGIIKGHMRLHARNVAMQAGARGHMVDIIAEKMIKEGNIRLDRAKELLKKISPQG
jgi:hydroxymethylglutaryl-CoA reductase